MKKMSTMKRAQSTIKMTDLFTAIAAIDRRHADARAPEAPVKNERETPIITKENLLKNELILISPIWRTSNTARSTTPGLSIGIDEAVLSKKWRWWIHSNHLLVGGKWWEEWAWCLPAVCPQGQCRLRWVIQACRMECRWALPALDHLMESPHLHRKIDRAAENREYPFTSEVSFPYLYGNCNFLKFWGTFFWQHLFVYLC